MRSLRHEGFGDRSVEMSLASCFIRESIEDGKASASEPKGKPQGGCRLAVRKLEALHQERGEFLFFARLRLQADKKANCNHFIAPIAINGHVSIYALVGDLNIGRTAIFSIISAMRIHVLVLDGVFDLGLSAILDGFQTANELIEMMELAVPPFEVKVVGMRKTVRTAHGLKIPIQPAGRQTPECVIVPAIASRHSIL